MLTLHVAQTQKSNKRLELILILVTNCALLGFMIQIRSAQSELKDQLYSLRSTQKSLVSKNKQLKLLLDQLVKK